MVHWAVRKGSSPGVGGLWVSGQHGWALVVNAQGMRGESRARENEKPTPIACSLACSRVLAIKPAVVALIYLHATTRLKGSYTNSCMRGLLDLLVGRNSNPEIKGPLHLCSPRSLGGFDPQGAEPPALKLQLPPGTLCLPHLFIKPAKCAEREGGVCET